jgi:hypothetical protein
MKLTEHMRYPHPVLSEYSSDYLTGEFRCAFEQQMTADEELKLVADLALNSRELRALIEKQQASVGYFVVCRRTYFNFLQEASLGQSEKYFDAKQLFGTVTIRPVVWTLSPVSNFSSPLIHKEFGSTVSLPRGSVIALGPEFRFSMDKKKFKPFESIFELAADDAVEPGMFSVDPSAEKITILAEQKTYSDLNDMRNLSTGKDLLLNAVYMPAIMDVVAALQSDKAGFDGKGWYRIFKAKCDDLGIDLSSPNCDPLDVAQKLLRAPLKKTVSAMRSMS